MQIACLAAQADLIFRVVSGVQFIRKIRDLVFGAGGQIDEAAAEILILVHYRPADAPQWRLRQLN